MKRLRLACSCSLLLAAATFFPFQAAAGDFAPWGVDLGLEIGQFKYEEPNFMSEEGPQYGLYAAYTHHFFENIRAQAYASVVGGDLDYDGGLQFTDGTFLAATGTSPNSIFNLRLTGGYRFPIGPVELTPFAGYGYRFLRNDLNVPLLGEDDRIYDDGGYWRDQTYHYLPLGVIVGAAVGGGWQIEGTLEYDVFLRGKNRSYSDFGSDNTFTQTGGSGYRFAVRILSPAFFDCVRVTAEPFYEHWEVDDSDKVIDGEYWFVEPANNSTLYGLRVGALL